MDRESFEDLVSDEAFDDDAIEVEYLDSDSGTSDEESSQSDHVHVDSEVPNLFTPPRDDAVMTLRGHRESVFCLAVDPLGSFIVSGAQDHTAIIWDIRTGTIAFTAEGHEDSVTCVVFTSDGQMLATGDMSGGVRVWCRPTATNPTWSLLLDEHVGDLHWLMWWSPPVSCNRPKPFISVLTAGDNDGLTTLWSVCPAGSARNAKNVKYIAGTGAAALSGVFYLPSVDTDRPRIVVLYQNAELRLWDIKSEESLTSITLKPPVSLDKEDEKGPCVFCLASPHGTVTRDPDQDLLAVGGSGVIYMIVIKYSGSVEPDFSTKCVAVLDTSDGSSVESLDFSWTHPYFAFCTADGTLGVVDNAKLRFRQKWTYSDEISDKVGFTCLRWSHHKPIFFTSTTHGAVIAWNGSGGGGYNVADSGLATTHSDPLFIWWGHQAMVLDLAIIPSIPATSASQAEAKFIASASDDSTVKLFPLDWSVG